MINPRMAQLALTPSGRAGSKWDRQQPGAAGTHQGRGPPAVL